jgi:Kef-type K+ transport system membrane component KefB
VTTFEFIRDNSIIDVLAGIGVLILLFEVGSNPPSRTMLKVGASSLLVAMLGVVTPFALGWGVGAWMLPDHSPYVHAFLGATLTATSVGDHRPGSQGPRALEQRRGPDHPRRGGDR